MSANEEFGRLTLDGTRFNSPGMPLEVMTEFVTYRRMLVEISKLLWRMKNSRNRKRRPFSPDDFDLRVTEFQPGCTIAILERPTDAFPLDSLKQFDHFSNAREAVEDTINEVHAGGEPKLPLDAGVLALFANFGKTLGPFEWIGSGPPSSLEPRARQTATTRDRFAELANRLPSLEPVTVYGYIRGLDVGQRKFVLQTPKRQISCDYTIAIARVIRSHLADEETSRPTVALTGMAARRRGAVHELPVIESIELAGDDAEEVVMEKFDLIKSLADGWNGPGSKAIPEIVCNNFQSFVDTLKSHLTVSVEPIATLSGGIRLEWEKHSISYVAEIEPRGGMYLCALPVDSAGDYDREFDAFDPLVLAHFVESGEIVD